MKTTSRLGAQLAALPPGAALAAGAVAIVNVTVLPMDSNRTLPHQTAPVEGERIVHVGPAAEVKEIVAFTKETGTWVVPTMARWEATIGSAAADVVANLPESKYLPKRRVENQRTNYVKKVTAPNFNAAQAPQIAADSAK